MSNIKLHLSLILFSLLISSCHRANTIQLQNIPVSQNKEFDQICTNCSLEELINAGFSFGDSVNISFSNGYELIDVPFYNGYYGKTKSLVYVAYPNERYPNAAFCNENGIWQISGLTENDTATITLNSKAKYIKTQTYLNQTKSNNLEDYQSEQAFANFREIKTGALKEKYIYRSATPCNTKYNCAPIVDDFIEENRINCALNLSDKPEKIKTYLENEKIDSPYYKSLFENKNVILFQLGTGYNTESYMKNVASGLIQTLDKTGPFVIHCAEGKDRTGFVCFILEALADSSVQEMEYDYMKTYENFFNVSLSNNSEKYNALKDHYFTPMLDLLETCKNYPDESYSTAASNYLIKAGMTKQQVEKLKTKICK